MTRHDTPALALGLLAFCTGVVVLLLALVLGFSIEATPSDTADSAMGHVIAVPGVVALVAGVLALDARRRRWGLAVAWVGAGAAVVAVLLAVLLPGGEQTVLVHQPGGPSRVGSSAAGQALVGVLQPTLRASVAAAR